MSAPRLLVTRAEPDANETARLIEKQGGVAIVAPARVAQTMNGPPPARPAGIIATSARAFRLGAAIPSSWNALPCLVVGPVTAEAARQAGFSDLRIAGGEARALAPFFVEFSGRRLVYLAGEPRRPELETDAAAAGVTLDLWLRYRMIESETLPPAAARALRDGTCDAVLHFSRESVESLVRQALAAGLMPQLAVPLHVCLAPAIARGVERLVPGSRVLTAAAREATSLIETALAALNPIDAPPRMGR